MMGALRSSETSVLTTATWRNIPEDGIFHSHRREKPQILHSTNNFKFPLPSKIANKFNSQDKKQQC
jgi:hypothetical protein